MRAYEKARGHWLLPLWYVLRHSRPPWSYEVEGGLTNDHYHTQQVLANAGFLLVNALSMLSPFGYTLRTPPEFLPGGWTTMDLWAAPLITCLYALLTCTQPCWVPAHRAVMGLLDAVGVRSANGQQLEGAPEGVDELTAQAICAIVLIVLFSWRALATHGQVQTKDVRKKAQ